MASFAYSATQLLGSLKTLPSRFAPRLNTLKAHALKQRSTAAQLIALGFGLHGVDAVYGPAAYIIGAVIVIVAVEIR